MAGLFTKAFTSLFGSKSERDIKSVMPLVELINVQWETISTLSNDELRNQTVIFKQTIRERLSKIETEIDELKKSADDLTDLQVENKTAIYEKVDLLLKDRDTELEAVLLDILPSAFAVVKETARRFKENEKVEVTAQAHDRDYAATKANVVIEGDKAIWANRWLAAGTEIVWDMMHYDVQLIGGIVLHSGKIAEMTTGEGKTLVATLPTYLNALAGFGVHIVTVNDYLSRRDSEWMAPLFEFHGLKVDCIDKHQPNSPQRKQAYLADITYGTNNEFGFDYLRDNMARTADELVQRKHHYAMIDEVDSVLVDDARTPLIISGPVPKGDIHEFHLLKPRIEKLVEVQRKACNQFLIEAKKLINDGKEQEAGFPLLRAYRGLPKNSALIKFLSEPGMRTLLNKTEGHYMQDQSKEMHKVDAELYFIIEEKNNSVDLTEKGIELITTQSDDTGFFIMPDVGTDIAVIEKSDRTPEDKIQLKEALMSDYVTKADRIHTVNQLLKAYCMYEKDVEYIIDNNKIKIVDEQTGRVLDGRRYSDGLHQALEAKENVKVESATQTWATVTLQNFFRMYHKLAGMTGTAETEAGELWEIYKLDVVVIPTNRPIKRNDIEDLVFKTKREKYTAVIEEIVKLVEAGRPVLVGTTSVEISELISRMLKLRNIKHNVLNAKQHQREAEVIQEAGLSGTVTIATNMAGRGTDIKLGVGVKEAGGLAIIGTERHESRRVDRQLRGRAGRQGDPGSSQFFVSLEDDLMRLFGSERISSIMDKMGMKEGEVIQHSMITKSIERAQKKVEENNFGIRKRLLEYDDVMNSQREVIYKKRRHALFGERLSIDIDNMFYDIAYELGASAHLMQYDEFKFEMLRLFSVDTAISAEDAKKLKAEEISHKIYTEAMGHYQEKGKIIAQMVTPVVKNVFENQGAQFENIVIPFQSGNRSIQLPVNLKRTYETEGKEVLVEFEKAITLHTIDEAWKEHLREMDDLKQSVQHAVYEQKDPLLIYKFEAYKLFKSMLSETNKEITSMLVRSAIPIQENDEVKEAPKRMAPPKVTASHSNNVSTTSGATPVYHDPSMEQHVTAPIRVAEKPKRNDPCPCGSGKKYKACHGINED